MIVNTRQVAEFFDVDDRTIRKWSSKGCPKYKHGKWNLKDVLAWWLDVIYDAKEESDEGIKKAKQDYWTHKAKREKIALDKDEGAVIEIEAFKDAWVWRVAEMAKWADSLERNLVDLVYGKTKAECRQAIHKEVRKGKLAFSRPGTHTPKVDIKKKKSRKKK